MPTIRVSLVPGEIRWRVLHTYGGCVVDEMRLVSIEILISDRPRYVWNSRSDGLIRWEPESTSLFTSEGLAQADADQRNKEKP